MVSCLDRCRFYWCEEPFRCEQTNGLGFAVFWCCNWTNHWSSYDSLCLWVSRCGSGMLVAMHYYILFYQCRVAGAFLRYVNHNIIVRLVHDLALVALPPCGSCFKTWAGLVPNRDTTIIPIPNVIMYYSQDSTIADVDYGWKSSRQTRVCWFL